MEYIAFIPVRGGSKSIPQKNIKNFCGKPLLYWTANAAQNSAWVDKVIIATDDYRIKEVAQSFNFSKVEIFDRSSKNASDSASTESVMLEYIEKNKIDIKANFILIQATSPFLTTEHLSSAIKKFNESGKDSLLSVARMKKFYWNDNGTPINYNPNIRPRRQDFKGTLVENGAFYINTIDNIIKKRNRLSGKVGVYEMPEYTITEIDEPDDWVFAEYIMGKYVLTKKNLNIKLVLSDVDGVLTDAGMYYSEIGDELKKFNTHDGKGFQLLREAGIKTGIITSENTKIVERRAKKLKVDFLYQGEEHGGKLKAAKEICNQLKISLDEVAYIGDDINCIELLSDSGLAACPADAVSKIKTIPNITILNTPGGHGAFREFAELVLKNINLISEKI